MSLSVIDLGVIPFKEAFSRQIQIQREVLEDSSSHTLILCEHPATITLGRQANISNILDYQFIKHNNMDFVVGVNRGGDVTYHGPGQLMGYLIFDLRDFGRNLGGFLNSIEGIIINTIARFGIQGYAKAGLRGVWAGEGKIASIGVGVDKWISLHGFALNVNTDLCFFDIIRPCGLNVKMMSMKECLGRLIDIDLVKQEIVKQVHNYFKLEVFRGGQMKTQLTEQSVRHKNRRIRQYC